MGRVAGSTSGSGSGDSFRPARPVRTNYWRTCSAWAPPTSVRTLASRVRCRPLLVEAQDRGCIGDDGHRLSDFSCLWVDDDHFMFTELSGDLW